MRHFLYCKLIIFIFFDTNAFSTSTLFDQNSVINNKIRYNNTLSSSFSSSIQSFTITTSIGFISKKLFDQGFFSPFGILPKKIKSLSPLAYRKKIHNNSKKKLLNNFCKIDNDSKKKLYSLSDKFYCKSIEDLNEPLNLEVLSKRYLD